MRFVAGRGAVAELLAGAPRRSCRPAWALQRRAIGKMLLTGAAAESHLEDIAGLGAAAKSHREDAADRRCGRAAGRLGRSGKVAGRGAVAKRQAGNAAMAKMLLAGALRRRGWLGTPWQSRRRRRGMAVARERHGRLARERNSRLARERLGRLAGNATADWHGNARNAKEPAPTDGTGPSQTFGCSKRNNL